MINPYDEKYDRDGLYWGSKPSDICYQVLKLMPPNRRMRLLDVGCGEGRNAIFFARNGYSVTAFDLSKKGVEKTRELSRRTGVDIRIFQADLLDYRLRERFDIIFSTGSLHYIPQSMRDQIIGNYKDFTVANGLNVFSVLINKSFIAKAPDAEATAQTWISGELFTHYHDWMILHCNEEIFDCNSSGVPHKHAVNRIIAQNPMVHNCLE